MLSSIPCGFTVALVLYPAGPTAKVPTGVLCPYLASAKFTASWAHYLLPVLTSRPFCQQAAEREAAAWCRARTVQYCSGSWQAQPPMQSLVDLPLEALHGDWAFVD